MWKKKEKTDKRTRDAKKVRRTYFTVQITVEQRDWIRNMQRFHGWTNNGLTQAALDLLRSQLQEGSKSLAKPVERPDLEAIETQTQAKMATSDPDDDFIPIKFSE